jgi:hypothetical protein
MFGVCCSTAGRTNTVPDGGVIRVRYCAQEVVGVNSPSVPMPALPTNVSAAS